MDDLLVEMSESLVSRTSHLARLLLQFVPSTLYYSSRIPWRRLWLRLRVLDEWALLP